VNNVIQKTELPEGIIPSDFLHKNGELRFRRNFLIIILLATLFMFLGVTASSYTLLRQHTLESAHLTLMSMSRSFLTTATPLLTEFFAGTQNERDAVFQLEEIAQTAAAIFPSLEYRVYDLDQVILLSNDIRQIGKTEVASEARYRAMNGFAPLPSTHSMLHSSQILETYLPVKLDGVTVAVLQVTANSLQFRSSLQHSLELQTLVLVIFISLIFGALYILTQRHFRLVEIVVQRLEDGTRTDFLTGTLNRRGFTTQIEEHLAKNRRLVAKKMPVSSALFIIDIDHFKHVNDTYGHPVGDIVLREVSQLLKDELRDYDVFARVGGEEFAAYLPDGTCDDFTQIAERVRLRIENSVIILSDTTALNITVSIGLTCCHHDESYETLFERADEALYQAKETGRNRVVSHCALKLPSVKVVSDRAVLNT
jgi:diguanylate cyclase (GGDEF)-like protein